MSNAGAHTPLMSSGCTADVRTTVPLMVMSCPILAVLRSRILQGKRHDDGIVRRGDCSVSRFAGGLWLAHALTC